MAKYKVGDKVRIVSERPWAFGFSDPMVKYLGKTLTVARVNARAHAGSTYRFEEAVDNGYYWLFSESWIAGLAEPQVKRHDNDLSVVIRFSGNKTTARLMRGETIVKTATARRNPADNYSRAEGARAAVERLFEKKRKEDKPKESKPKAGDKFVVTGNRPFGSCHHFFKIGSVVELVRFWGAKSSYVDERGLEQTVRAEDVRPYKENSK